MQDICLTPTNIYFIGLQPNLEKSHSLLSFNVFETISPKRKHSRFRTESSKPQTTFSQHAANASFKLYISKRSG